MSLNDEFFIVASPGLEDVTAAELKTWYPDLEFKMEHGGLTVHAPRPVGLSFNLTLKTATRVLLRVARFSCRDFPKLFKKVSGLPWEEWIEGAPDVEVEVATRLSRLKIKKRIESTVGEAWLEALKQRKQTPAKNQSITLYVRLFKDECTLSLDTSGERLHKRGERVLIGEAPLRESLASSLIQMTASLSPSVTSVEIVDPMMGSGTFLLEALNVGTLQSGRDFAFSHLKSAPVEAPSHFQKSWNVRLAFGIEADAKTVRAAEANLKTRFKDGLTVIEEDLFKAKPLPEKLAEERWLFCNPPYGERLKLKEPAAEYYQKLMARADLVASPDRACFLFPAKAVKGKFTLPPGWKVVLKKPFSNGGIPVIAFVFQKVSGLARS